MSDISLPLWGKCLIFGCLGITTEIFFTSFTDLFINISNGQNFDLKLQGKSYAWMFIIYGSTPILYHLLFDYVEKWPTLFRLILTVSIIYIIEYISGYILEIATGACPWKYDKGWHINGFIRLDYAPFWLIFAFFLEKIYLLTSSMYFKTK